MWVGPNYVGLVGRRLKLTGVDGCFVFLRVVDRGGGGGEEISGTGAQNVSEGLS